MKKLFIMIAVVSIAGCSNLRLQWQAEYHTDNFFQDVGVIPPDASPQPAAPAAPAKTGDKSI